MSRSGPLSQRPDDVRGVSACDGKVSGVGSAGKQLRAHPVEDLVKLLASLDPARDVLVQARRDADVPEHLADPRKRIGDRDETARIRLRADGRPGVR